MSHPFTPRIHEFTEEIVCPHCGYEHGDSYEYGDGRKDYGRIFCRKCVLEFAWSRDTTVTYSTQKIEQKGKQ